MKHTNIHIIRAQEGEDSEQGLENIFEEIMTENFPNLMKENDTQVHEAQRISNKMNSRRPTPRHIIIKMINVKGKERISKAARQLAA